MKNICSQLGMALFLAVIAGTLLTGCERDTINPLAPQVDTVFVQPPIPATLPNPDTMSIGIGSFYPTTLLYNGRVTTLWYGGSPAGDVRFEQFGVTILPSARGRSLPPSGLYLRMAVWNDDLLQGYTSGPVAAALDFRMNNFVLTDVGRDSLKAIGARTSGAYDLLNGIVAFVRTNPGAFRVRLPAMKGAVDQYKDQFAIRLVLPGHATPAPFHLAIMEALKTGQGLTAK